MKRRSLETFTQSNAILGNEPMVKKSEILEVEQYHIYVK